MPPGTPASERNRFMLLSTELFATPGLYAQLIASTGSTIASGVTVSRFPAPDVCNAMLNSVAAFYASQGITILMGEDTSVFALEWITTFHSRDSTSNNNACAARDRIEALLSRSVVPPGLNENVWTADGLVIRPSIPVPGTVYFPVQPPPAPDNSLSYGSPLHEGESSSGAAVDSGSSSSNPTPVQANTSDNTLMEGVNDHSPLM
ncbi:hypothetical protein BT96DRAFT_987076 [Gymnopus androsaceus JB14]|uniref:Uncharacterized protein n=1 Tax=Gymnopus androsaceus JB14 TaxID=1447944 RepID=A0A6A4ICH4_9AGAR|nr:hypothetical protein BT96DRAFT_987076 [Gymnopus androsaceus JB14]